MAGHTCLDKGGLGSLGARELRDQHVDELGCAVLGDHIDKAGILEDLQCGQGAGDRVGQLRTVPYSATVWRK
jgi:hypothetical protein